MQKTIKVNYLTRVEGEGSLYIKIKDNRIKNIKFKIFEPPRFFEAFLRGRDYSEAPDITARICGICPVAYQMSSVHAMEQAFHVSIEEPLRALRRLIYCGEWIESHVLHVYMLHAPDFLGYEDAIRMAADYPEEVKKGLRLKKIGNELVSLLGGREIHPINVRVGGFYKTPSEKSLKELGEKLAWAKEAALDTLKFVSAFSFPDFEQDYEFVSLGHAKEYPMNQGRIVSNQGLDLDVAQYNQHFREEQVAHSSALHAEVRKRGNYFVGPLARFNLNFDKLTPLAQEKALEAGLTLPCRNPFKSIIVRSVEVLYAVEEALRIIESYEPPQKPSVDFAPRKGMGHGCTEAPRGLLYHRYQLDEQGTILDAQIIPPTSQNQKTIEKDLYHYVSQWLDLPDDQLTWQCEQAIRNYDPCISCATHFLNLEVYRE